MAKKRVLVSRHSDFRSAQAAKDFLVSVGEEVPTAQIRRVHNGFNLVIRKEV